MPKVLLPYFAVSDFRSFDKQCQPVADLQKVNLFVGQNNAGKSNVIVALRMYCLAMATEQESKLELQRMLADTLNRPIKGEGGAAKVWFQIPSQAEDVFPKCHEWSLSFEGRNQKADVVVNQILASIREGIGNGGYVSALPGSRTLDLDANSLLTKGSPKYGGELIYRELFSRYSDMSGGGVTSWVDFFFKKLNPINRLQPLQFVEVPAVRKLIDAGSTFDGTFGDGALIQKIAEWERPDAINLNAYTEKFAKLLQFVRTVLEDPNVQLQVPYKRDTIHVIKDGKTLPIERLGTGIHQIVMLAAAATVIDDSIFAIEEPETNLHPTLQRKLVQYLHDQTSNQYFITTHSAHILDACPATVFRVSLQDGMTRLSRLSSASSRFSAIEDIGYRASDIIQTPLVIWVEGPSDRIYISAWLKATEPTLIEGIHFSIMFYGGRLLSHLTAQDDSEIDDFISLRKLNRYVAVVIDSDRKAEGDQINATKKRLADEIEREPDFSHVWISEGREIENYLDPAFIPQSFQAVVSDFGRLTKVPKASNFLYSKALDYVDSGGRKASAAHKKVAFARAYVTLSDGRVPSVDSLSAHLGAVVILVKKANGLM